MFKNRRFATFQLDRIIHENVHSLIYKTELQTNKPKTILKILKPDANTEKEIIRLHNEFLIAKKIRSPYVIQMFGLIKDQRTIALAIEDIDAQSLRTCFERARPTLIEGLEIAISLCKGLEDIHKEKIIHKNICSSNILWNRNTNVLKIIDFSIATILPQEEAKPNMPNTLEGNLLYMSPEQTGRMNRSIDYRADFYSLGVTLYELFTGTLPFSSIDPLELIHSHIAKNPDFPETSNPKLPTVLKKIILKLLQKEPENRYQSSAGIACDLSDILQQLQTKGSVDEFVLATEDTHEQFIIAKKLFGRETFILKLHQVFTKVCHGGVYLSLVKGYSGVGKTTLVQELYRPLTIARGRYLVGKFDQYNQNVPYSALIPAFHGLCDQILTKSEEKIAQWKRRMQGALGKNGQLILDIFPRFINIIGPQPVVPIVDPQSAKNRFNTLFINFVSVLCNIKEPMVLFLDDLQWADQGSLDLVKLMLVNSKIEALHLVGAYRDNEVEASHPLLLLLDEIKRTDHTYDVIALDNLNPKDVNNLVKETLLLSEKKVTPLAQLIYQKTLGNAFYVTEFFKMIYSTGALKKTNKNWEWDLDEIERQHVSENVVEFVAKIIKCFNIETQNVLGIAACIGNVFDLETLSIVLDLSNGTPDILRRLLPAITAGIIIPKNNKYISIGIADTNYSDVIFKFQHDRVQQASYSLINNQDRQNIHYCIGNLLLHYLEKTNKLEERLFEVVGHFQHAVVKTHDERIQIAELYYRAGMKARAVSAYKASSEYFLHAKNLLPNASFKIAYALSFKVILELAKSYYLNSQFTHSTALYTILIKRAENTMDKVSVKIVQMEDYHLQGNYKKAIEIQKQALALLDDQFPLSSKVETAIVSEFKKTPHLLAGRDTDMLLQAPELTSPEILAKLRILVGMWANAYIVSNSAVVQWCSIRMTNLTLEFGNSEFASFAFGQYGYLCVLRLKNVEEGRRFGLLGIALADQNSNIEMRGKVYFNFSLCVSPWTQPLETSTYFLRKAYQLSLDSGDWAYAAYAAAVIISNLIIEGKKCEHIFNEGKQYLDFLKEKANVSLNSFFLPGAYVPLLNLMGKTISPDSFDCEHLNEKTLLDTLGKLPIVQAWFYSAKIKSAFLLQYFDYTADVIIKADIVLEGVPTQVKITESFFYTSLVIAATFEMLQDNVLKQKYLNQFEKYKNAFQGWAEQCPTNFLHQWLLIRAEEYWLKGSGFNETLSLYDLAFDEASKGGFLNIAALAQELKGRFWIKHNQSEYGLINLGKAYRLYQEWGVDAKVEQLSTQFPAIHRMPENMVKSSKFIQRNELSEAEIDFQSIYKITQSLSQNLEWDALVSDILTIVMENMGANRSALFLKEGSGWVVVADSWLDSNTGSVVLNNKKSWLKDSKNHPLFVVNKVINSLEIINMDSCNIPLAFCSDPFIQNKTNFSIVCAPIQSHGNLIGIIYLENEFVSQGFNINRINVLNMFLSQIAISIENARLFANADKTAELYERAQEVERLNKSLQDTLTQLQRSNIELDKFIHVASHHLKAPLRVIDNTAKWLEDDLHEHLTEDTRQSMDLLRERVKTMEKLVDDLLDYSRIERTKENVSSETITGDALVINILSQLLPPKRFKVFIHPEFADIRVARMPLQQILMNLISNAIKHHDRNDGYIEIWMEESSEYFTFAVKDDGPGIPAQFHEQIFEMFQTIKPQGQVKASGMGLTLVRKIIAVHGGKLKLESSVGEGSVFSFTWPKDISQANS